MTQGPAGHYVKMVHTGIEYADMQLIAEVDMLLRRGRGVTAEQAAGLFAEWNDGELECYLIDITADILLTRDPENDAAPLVDAILDRAGQKGTGRWTVKSALDLAVAAPTLAAAVDARVISSAGALRAEASRAFAGTPAEPLRDVAVGDLHDALLGAKIASYSQGFELLAAASAERGYGTDLSEIARIWKAGCIIRARLLDRIRAAYEGDAPPILALAPSFRADLEATLPAWRKVVSAATLSGLPIPGLSASLAWLDGLRTDPGSASLIQAQRDYFGSHGYRRKDAPDVPVHTDWPRRSEA